MFSRQEHAPEVGGTVAVSIPKIDETENTAPSVETPSSISILESANIPAGDLSPAPGDLPKPDATTAPAWQGDPRYFQSGKKQGTLKPEHRDAAEPATPESPAPEKPAKPARPKFFTAPAAGATKPPSAQSMIEGMQATAQKDLIEARANATADQALMMLDMINTMVSGGNYKADPKARKDAHAVFKNYAILHNFALPPWLEVTFTATMYCAPAFMVRPAPDVPSVGERVKKGVGGWFANKIISKIF